MLLISYLLLVFGFCFLDDAHAEVPSPLMNHLVQTAAGAKKGLTTTILNADRKASATHRAQPNKANVNHEVNSVHPPMRTSNRSTTNIKRLNNYVERQVQRHVADVWTSNVRPELKDGGLLKSTKKAAGKALDSVNVLPQISSDLKPEVANAISTPIREGISNIGGVKPKHGTIRYGDSEYDRMDYDDTSYGGSGDHGSKYGKDHGDLESDEEETDTSSSKEEDADESDSEEEAKDDTNSEEKNEEETESKQKDADEKNSDEQKEQEEEEEEKEKEAEEDD